MVVVVVAVSVADVTVADRDQVCFEFVEAFLIS